MKRARPIADLVGPALGAALAARGFSGADIVASWPEIAGERLAAVSRPLKVEWPRRTDAGRRPDPATVLVRVEGAFALEMQHLAPVLVERINAVYGWRCVGRLVLKQGPVGRRAAPARRPPPDPETLRKVADAVAPVADEGLRGALARLGTAVATDRREEASEPPLVLSGRPPRLS